MTSCHGALRVALPSPWCRFTGLFRFGETCGRVLSLAIFSCSWGAWTCALLGVDFLILLVCPPPHTHTCNTSRVFFTPALRAAHAIQRGDAPDCRPEHIWKTCLGNQGSGFKEGVCLR